MLRLRDVSVLLGCWTAALARAQSGSGERPSGSSFVNTNIFEPVSTPAHEVHSLSLFVLLITAGIFVGVSTLLVIALVRYRCRPGETGPALQAVSTSPATQA